MDHFSFTLNVISCFNNNILGYGHTLMHAEIENFALHAAYLFLYSI